jgi:hypothetical protein
MRSDDTNSFVVDDSNCSLIARICESNKRCGVTSLLMYEDADRRVRLFEMVSLADKHNERKPWNANKLVTRKLLIDRMSLSCAWRRYVIHRSVMKSLAHT